MDDLIGPNSPPDARPATYWDGRGLFMGDAGYQRMSPAVFEGMVGEHLPPLDDGEVEIVMIGMRSMMGDVISIRAQRDGDTIRYRVVDEDEGVSDGGPGYTFEPHESSKPLSFTDITAMIWSLHVPDWGHFFEQGWEEQRDCDLETYENDFYELQSDFYRGLQEWLEERFEKWRRRRIHDAKE